MECEIMHENDTTDVDATDSPTSGVPASPRRRRFLGTLAAPPTIAALAGCSFGGDGATDPIVEDLEPGDTAGYPGAVRFGNRYVMAVTRATDGESTLSGRFYHRDRFLRFENDGNVVESYLVDGDGYVVTGDQCVEYPDLGAGFESVAAVDADLDPDAPAEPELAVTGRTTIDGRTVLVLELPAGELAADEAGVTYYVDDETRYLRRIEAETVVVDYHSWNEIDPIQVPDLDCRPIG